MGTNYYVLTGKKERKICNCGFEHEVEESLHIGKNSYGWMFSLQIFPEKGILELEDWTPILRSGKIRNEYGEELSYEEMRKIILKIDEPTPLADLSQEGREKELQSINQHSIGYQTVMDEKSFLLRVSSHKKGKQGNYCLVEGNFS